MVVGISGLLSSQVLTHSDRSGFSPSRNKPPSLGSHIVAGAFAGMMELTFGGNVLSVLMANRIAGNPEKVIESKKRGFFSHYYGQSYVYNLAFRTPFVATILTGVYFANQLLDTVYPSAPLSVRVSAQALAGGTFSLPIALANERFLANRANNNAAFKDIIRGGLSGFTRSMTATWMRETLFIGGPICCSPYMKEWISDRFSLSRYSWGNIGITYVCSAVSGVVVAIVSQPAHVISVTQQSCSQDRGILETARTIIGDRGYGGLFFPGLMPRLVRIGLCSGILVLSSQWWLGAMSKTEPTD